MNHLLNLRCIAILLSMSLLLAGAVSATKANEPAAKETADSAATETGDHTDESTANKKRPRRRRPLEERKVIDFGPRKEVYLENGLKKERTVHPFETKHREDSDSTEPAADIERATVSAKSSEDATSTPVQQTEQTPSSRITWIATILASALVLCVVLWLSKRQARFGSSRV